MTAGSVSVPTILPLRPPTRSKLDIDTNTLIELQTDTNGANIYYTVNGQKPDPFQKLGERHTDVYERPFTLIEGKQTVKAMALLSNPVRASSVVTKTFRVTAAEGNESEDDGLGEIGHLDSVGSHTGNKVESLQLGGQILTQPRFLNSRLGAVSRQSTESAVSPMPQLPSNLQPASSKSDAEKLLKQTDYLRCVQCFAPRPSDPYARFCPNCGAVVPLLPTSRQAPPQSGMMGTCLKCQSPVPLTAPSCLVCEAPLQPQLQPQASRRLQARLLCCHCSSVNPSHMEFCVTCESRLQEQGKLGNVFNGLAPEPPPFTYRTKCSKCGRLNAGDARFCDWCGNKNFKSQQPVSCLKCAASNSASARFCLSCGSRIEPPNSQPEKQELTWASGSTSAKHNTRSQGSQTEGLFFKSARALESASKAEEQARSQREAGRDRRLQLTTYSPGRGFWRQQVEHVCSHLKAYAQNSQDFQKAIGQPQMGKLTAATVHDDGNEVTLTITYPLKDVKGRPLSAANPQASQALLSTLVDSNGYNFKQSSSLSLLSETSSLNFDDNEIESTTKTKKKTRRKTKPSKDLLSSETQLVFREVNSTGQGRLETVERLIDKGADPNRLNKEGLSAVAVAAVNDHHDCIRVLVEKGADINLKMR
ncbi:double zinc ribbon and ankyrin repeat-containing protein 1-like isoform X2 [Corticium candelabrum]|nr:double zinc ribbon and ankyrin repeat-containing protein 1-like isoform X2 [Corticium candelabrum]